jgi:hypothetical protein
MQLGTDRARSSHMKHLIAEMEVKVAGVGDEVDQACLHQRHDRQKEEDRLEDFLAIGFGILNRTKLIFDCSRVQEGVFDDQLAEVQRGSEREFRDRLRVN